MRLDQWLDAERGRLTKMAEHFGVTPSAVSQWRANGVPVDNIMAVHEYTDRHVTLHDMLPPANGGVVPAPEREPASPP